MRVARADERVAPLSLPVNFAFPRVVFGAGPAEPDGGGGAALALAGGAVGGAVRAGAQRAVRQFGHHVAHHVGDGDVPELRCSQGAMPRPAITRGR